MCLLCRVRRYEKQFSSAYPSKLMFDCWNDSKIRSLVENSLYHSTKLALNSLERHSTMASKPTTINREAIKLLWKEIMEPHINYAVRIKGVDESLARLEALAYLSDFLNRHYHCDIGDLDLD